MLCARQLHGQPVWTGQCHALRLAFPSLLWSISTSHALDVGHCFHPWEPRCSFSGAQRHLSAGGNSPGPTWPRGSLAMQQGVLKQRLGRSLESSKMYHHRVHTPCVTATLGYINSSVDTDKTPNPTTSTVSYSLVFLLTPAIPIVLLKVT